MPFRRVILIVLDGVGIGGMPDAVDYGDADAATLQHVAEAAGGLELPNLDRLGLARVAPYAGGDPQVPVCGAYGSMRERACGKDSTAGHWELMGVVLDAPLPSFPNGFPREIIRAFEQRIGVAVLGNIAASGTDIIQRLGPEHLRTGCPIVYTSVDSVFQVAAHVDRVPKEQLYQWCETARELLNPLRVGRVIARPFAGSPEQGFARVAGRHDYSLPPVGETVLDRLTARDIPVHAIGKICDLYAGRGLSTQLPTANNDEGMDAILAALAQREEGLIFANLVDFDMVWGHRLDWAGFARGLGRFDAWLETLLPHLEDDDLLLITADHGCDPTTPGTDHTRERVPVLAWQAGFSGPVELGERDSFADVGATVADNFGVDSPVGRSFLGALTSG
ncbi:MAG: phosphopentomutase [Deltaproteobacteria bacterium]|nr:MAG: phosphopentomutase [Deltaproteobacteria bacterium]